MASPPTCQTTTADCRRRPFVHSAWSICVALGGPSRPLPPGVSSTTRRHLLSIPPHGQGVADAEGSAGAAAVQPERHGARDGRRYHNTEALLERDPDSLRCNLTATVQADGNCLFRAIALHLFGDQEQHAVIRAAIVAEVRAHLALYAPFERDPAAWCDRMQMHGEWGDNLAIQAAATRFAVDIEIITSVQRQPNLHVRPQRIEAVPHNLEMSRISRIRLAYIAQLHYDAAFPAGTELHR